MRFISKITATYANIEGATLWIPETALPDTAHVLGKQIVEEYKPTVWRFRIHRITMTRISYFFGIHN